MRQFRKKEWDWQLWSLRGNYRRYVAVTGRMLQPASKHHIWSRGSHVLLGCVPSMFRKRFPLMISTSHLFPCTAHCGISPVLSIVERIKFKILLLTWKIVHGFAPHYFDDLTSEYVPSRNLRSSGTRMLTPHRVKCSFGEKVFATSAPVLWNALHSNVRNAKSVELFKSGLKTYMFSSYFDKLFPLLYISLCASE